MKEIKNKIFPFIIALSALSVSASAAYYSVTGLSKLFAGASTQVMIMAGSLEVAKLVIASLLYQYWDEINKALRTYLMVASVVLVLITSMGIYGYLSSAYQVTVTQAGTNESRIELLETKKSNITQQRDLYNTEKSNLIQGITQLQGGLTDNKSSYVDKRGNLVQYASSSNRKSFEKQLDNSTARQNEISIKLDTLNNRIFDLNTQIVETKASGDKAGELGPLIYLNKLTGIPMDNIINYLLLVIIFVFDPLAIALVIAANFAFAQLGEKDDKVLKNFKQNLSEIDLDSQVEDDWYHSDVLPKDEFEYVREEIEDPSKSTDEVLTSPNLPEDVVIQEGDRILKDKKDFGGGNFRVRPPQDPNIIDYN
jgi:hypothetical protein